MVNVPEKHELAWWLDARRRYFARQASREGFELDDDILTVFERFDVVWPLNVRTPNAAAVKMDAWLTFGAQYRDGLGPGFSQSQVLGRAISCGVGCWLLQRRFFLRLIQCFPLSHCRRWRSRLKLSVCSPPWGGGARCVHGDPRSRCSTGRKPAHPTTSFYAEARWLENGGGMDDRGRITLGA
jgi:hypothetical protein